MRLVKIIDTNSVKNIFDKTNYVTIIGDAGSGKSMLVKHLFLNTLETNYAIPLVFDLRDLNKSNISFNQFVKNHIFENELAVNDKILERTLASGIYVFFLDGFDELNKDSLDKFIYDLNSFINKYDENKFVITSRPHSNVRCFLFSITIV